MALLLQRQGSLNPSTALLHAVAAIVLVLYAAGLAGALWWGAVAIHVCGTGLLTFELLRRARGSPMAWTIPVPYGLLALLAGAFYALHGNDLYLYYDEYAHWGIFVKEMLAFDSFWPADTNAMHPRYPPAAPLWQYLFNVFMPFNEGFTYFGQFVLLTVPLLVLWESIAWRHIGWSVGILALCALVLTNFGLGITSLYVDHLLGVWFAGTVFSFVVERDMCWPRMLWFTAPIAVIALIKDVGLLLALGAAAIIAALYAWRAWRLHGAKPRVVQTAALLVVLVAPAWIGMETWSANRDHVGAAEDGYSVSGIVAGLIGGSGDDDSNDAEVSRRFFEVFFAQQLSNDALSRQFNEFSYGIRDLFTDRFRLTTATLFLAFVAWSIVLALLVLTTEARWTFGIVACGFLGVAAGYIATLYFSYGFTFGDRGLELPSYIRYVHTVILPLALCAFAPLLPAFRPLGGRPAWSVAGRPVPRHATMFAAALVALYALEPPHLQPLVRPNERIPVREAFEPAANAVHARVGRAQLWLHLPQDWPNGFVGRLLQYLLTPTRVRVERSEQFLQRPEREIRATWKGVDYIWIPLPLPDEVADDWARLVPGAPPLGLFAVRSTANGAIEISPVIAAETESDAAPVESGP